MSLFEVKVPETTDFFNLLVINHQCVFFQLFQAEMFSRQQILHSIISDGQRMLEQGQVDDR